MRPFSAHLGAVVCLAFAASAACTVDYGAVQDRRSVVGGTEGTDQAVAHSISNDFPRSASCASCHATIYQQWSTSMHARASTSITTVVQTNLVAKAGLFDGPRAAFCVNCHAPVQATATKEGTLPVSGAAAAGLDDGVSCGACHQYGRTPRSGAGGVAADYSLALTRGPTFYGPIADPFPSTAHASEHRITFADQGGLCANCHDVNLDRDGDALIHPVRDLVLQTTHAEYDAYRQSVVGAKTCAQCHMPVLEGVKQPAEGVAGAPERPVHDHRFVGVDRALDGSPDTQAEARKALLAGAAKLEATTDGAGVTVSIVNSGTGHALPSGFAFTRQMWLEVVVRDAANTIVFASGLVRDARADLCDAETLASPLRRFLDDCLAPDAQLTSFQQKLVDEIVPKLMAGVPVKNAAGELVPQAADSANEVLLQHALGGAVPRIRPHDGAVLRPIAPGERRSFAYALPEVSQRPLTVSVRLLFRALAPYFVRGLMEGHVSRETALSKLEIIEMARTTLTP